MLLLFAISGLSSLTAVSGNGRWCDGALWSLDKHTVMVGGCVTLIVNKPWCELDEFAVRIDDGDSVNLQKSAVFVRRERSRTLVLVSHDFVSPDGFEFPLGDMGRYRLVPIFNKPGNVSVTLERGSTSCGTREVNVVPLAGETKAAMHLLYPEVVRGNGTSATSRRVLQMLANPAYGVAPPIKPTELGDLAADADVVRRHPDWGEIIDMLVARVELVMQASASVRDGTWEYPDNADAARGFPVPERASAALEKEVVSAFAKAVQNNIRDTLALRGTGGEGNPEGKGEEQ